MHAAYQPRLFIFRQKRLQYQRLIITIIIIICRFHIYDYSYNFGWGYVVYLVLESQIQLESQKLGKITSKCFSHHSFDLGIDKNVLNETFQSQLESQKLYCFVLHICLVISILFISYTIVRFIYFIYHNSSHSFLLIIVHPICISNIRLYTYYIVIQTYFHFHNSADPVSGNQKCLI